VARTVQVEPLALTGRVELRVPTERRVQMERAERMVRVERPVHHYPSPEQIDW
jgi:hypothetical protein